MTGTAQKTPEKATERPRGASRPSAAPVPPRIGEIVRYTVSGTLLILPAIVVEADGDRITAQVFRQSGDGTFIITEVPRGRPAEPRTWHPASERPVAGPAAAGRPGGRDEGHPAATGAEAGVPVPPVRPPVVKRAAKAPDPFA